MDNIVQRGSLVIFVCMYAIMVEMGKKLAGAMKQFQS